MKKEDRQLKEDMNLCFGYLEEITKYKSEFFIPENIDALLKDTELYQFFICNLSNHEIKIDIKKICSLMESIRSWKYLNLMSENFKNHTENFLNVISQNQEKEIIKRYRKAIEQLKKLLYNDEIPDRIKSAILYDIERLSIHCSYDLSPYINISHRQVLQLQAILIFHYLKLLANEYNKRGFNPEWPIHNKHIYDFISELFQKVYTDSQTRKKYTPEKIKDICDNSKKLGKSEKQYLNFIADNHSLPKPFINVSSRLTKKHNFFLFY